MGWKDSGESLEETTSIDEVGLENVVPKSYSMTPTLHRKLVDEAKRRSRLEGRRVSASQIMSELVHAWEPGA